MVLQQYLKRVPFHLVTVETLTICPVPHYKLPFLEGVTPTKSISISGLAKRGYLCLHNDFHSKDVSPIPLYGLSPGRASFLKPPLPGTLLGHHYYDPFYPFKPFRSRYLPTLISFAPIVPSLTSKRVFWGGLLFLLLSASLGTFSLASL